MSCQMEDVAIAYGFNKIPRLSPNKSAIIAKPLPINKLGDIVRLECASAGWLEVMPLALCSHEENFEWLRRVDDGTTAIKLANPKSLEYQVVRTSLLPGLLKTIRENKSVRLPLTIFEVSDVALKDESQERKTKNERRWGAAFCGKRSGFEDVHGLLDRIMAMLSVPFVPSSEADGYFLEEIKEPTFFEGRAASVNLRQGGKAQRIGEFGILHPEVLKHYDLK